MTDETRIQSFADFWPYYLGEHRNPTNRALHYIGTGAAIGIVVYATVVGPPALGLWALLAGYGCAWIGHFLIEHNRPATFTYPRWSLAGDFKMLFYFLTGRIGGELVRLYGGTHPSADTQLRADPSGTEPSE